jgi:histidinol-phosphate aminotransferase
VASLKRRAGARYHGDEAAEPGALDFAVNVRSVRPLIDRLAARLDGLGHYPSAADVERATTAVATRDGRHRDQVVLLAGGAEGFAMLPQLQPRLAALLTPSFTEPEVDGRYLRVAERPAWPVLVEAIAEVLR